MDDNYFWWVDKHFEVDGKQLDMYQMPIDPMKPEVPPVICRVRGADHVLHVYQIEVVGGQFDGNTFYAGHDWLIQYIQPD